MDIVAFLIGLIRRLGCIPTVIYDISCQLLETVLFVFPSNRSWDDLSKELLSSFCECLQLSYT
ncbi:hypothetical protein B9H04_14315 [Halorubrum ezzemoulense DSM 17463]|uniref:Uncharacterized protein n=1 Tax=Halorubrum ezzemoulense DSM 17463 TaxID=1121945 RepID=A0A1X4GBI4_HALEZ|nr:hypothetical protein B9H04_14315 [Halorubrum ezzemoulense DSM 17463]